MLRLKPEYKIWSRDKALNAKVRRKGFEVVPDFGGTAHAYCGESLEVATGDLLEWHRRPSHESMLRAYIIKSRVRDVANLLIVQPFSPVLFRQGVLPGPDLLLRRQRREITVKELKRLWKDHEDKQDAAEQAKDWPWSMLLPCRTCSIHEDKEILKPLEAFGSRARSRNELWKDLISEGEDLSCLSCRKLRFKESRLLENRMFCDGCYKSLPPSSFSEVDSAAWKKSEARNYLCLKCNGDAATKTRKDLEILECRKCNMKWPEHHYHVETLRRWQEKESHVLFCALCEAEQRKDKRLNDVYTCGQSMKNLKNKGCNKEKELREFAPATVRYILEPKDSGHAVNGYRCKAQSLPVSSMPREWLRTLPKPWDRNAIPTQ